MRQSLAQEVREEDHVRGSSSTPVTLLEYGDFECPYSAEAALVVQALQDRLGDRLRFVFRHFPLVQKHSHAFRAAEASEAAAEQGRFWEMYEWLFVNQARLTERDLARHASALQLDRARFDRAMADRTYAERVETDVMGGKKSGVRRTPTFFINGLRYEGPDDLNKLLDAVVKEEARHQVSPASG